MTTSAKPPEIVTLGFTVYASIKGAKEPQPISTRYSSKQAALDFAALAKRQGYVDAYVSDVLGVEKSGPRATKAKAAMQPKGLL